MDVLTLYDSFHSRTGDPVAASNLVLAHAMLGNQPPTKEWYTPRELGEILTKSEYTVRERWCNEGRIECEKDPDSGKWRIPHREVERLRNGGALSSRR